MMPDPGVVRGLLPRRVAVRAELHQDNMLAVFECSALEASAAMAGRVYAPNPCGWVRSDEPLNGRGRSIAIGGALGLWLELQGRGRCAMAKPQTWPATRGCVGVNTRSSVSAR